MKNYLLILLSLFLVRANGQNCNFNSQTSPGTTVVTFSPNAIYVQGPFQFVWDFGDGTVDTTTFPMHTYNGIGPYVACYTVYDTGWVVQCHACDTIYLGTTVTCLFTATNTGTAFTFTSVGTPAGQVNWDFGDGTTDTGAVVTHNYTSGGNYTVTMTVIDWHNHNILCQYFHGVAVQGSNTCSFSSSVQGNTAVFSANNIANSSTVTWDFGDNTTGTGMNATHQYNSSGSFTVCMYVVDSNGIACHSCQTVLVNTLPGNCYFTATPDPHNANTITFTAFPAFPTVPPQSNPIVFDFGDGTTDTGTVLHHTYSQPGTYNVCMYEYDQGGILFCTFCTTVTIHGANTCFFTYAPSIIDPLTINFQANGNNTFAWDFGDGTTGQGTSLNHTYTAPGIYNVCMSSGSPGTSNYCSFCMWVTVGNTTSFCTITYYQDPFNPANFTFTSSSSSPSSMIMWDFGDGNVGTGQTIGHSYAHTGTYTVCVIERDTLQNIICQSCVTVHVGGGNGTVCQASYLATSYGLDAYFVDMSIASASPVTYGWDFGDGTTSNLQFPMHTYALPGVYNVCLVIDDGTCSDTFCSPVLVDTALHNPSNGCNAFFAYIQLAPYQVTVVNLSTGNNLSFDWDYGDGSPHDYTAYPSHVYTTTGTYNLCLTVTGPNGCVSSYCDTLSVDSLGNIYRRSQTGFTLNVVSPAQLTGVKEIAVEKSFNIYPNPFTSELHVTMISGTKQATDYRIFAVQGAEVLRGKLEGMDGTINTQSLTPGVYLLEVTMNDGSRGFQSVIKN